MMRYFSQFKVATAWKWGALAFLILAWIDYVTGYQISLVGFYFLVVAFLSWCCGRRAALQASFIGAALWWGVDHYSDHQYTYSIYGFWNAFMRLLLFGVGGVSIAELRKAMDEKQALINELKQSLDQVKTLSGMLPTCPSCRRIRGDEGHWESLETYVRNNAHIEFIESVCPDCVDSTLVRARGATPKN